MQLKNLKNLVWSIIKRPFLTKQIVLPFKKMLLIFHEIALNKIYEPLGKKLLTRLRLGFSHFSEHKFKHNFADSLNPLCSCSLETESTPHFFYAAKIILLCELKNINDATVSLNENDLLHVMMYGNKNFDMNINILTATIKFMKNTERFDQPLF